jgi:ribonuclease P protein component
LKRSSTKTQGDHLRHQGVRVSAGPWTVFAERNQDKRGILIVALGKKAGPAVARSRIRRIARDIFKKAEATQGMVLDLLLLARSDVSSRPRRHVRTELSVLMARVPGALARREARPKSHA